MKKSIARFLRVVGLGLILGAGVFWWKMESIGSERLENVRARVEMPLKQALAAAELSYGAPVFLRVLKEESELELWMQQVGGQPWKLFRKWRIANYSGTLGPKLREGDLQAPEGFYEVGIKQLNPMSRFHLSFNIGYPNAYDQHHGRTGSLIMVHGSNVSIGCFAMTDPVIEEIYLLVEAALKAGQVAVPVHVFPFRMTAERIAQAEAERATWLGFWRDELAPSYAAFEKNGVPPGVKSVDGRYEIVQMP
jgi:murein L,D-transpeptidase YafK